MPVTFRKSSTIKDDGHGGSPRASGRAHPLRGEETTLYQLVQEHLKTFLAQVELETGAGLPEFVKEEFDAYLTHGSGVTD